MPALGYALLPEEQSVPLCGRITKEAAKDVLRHSTMAEVGSQITAALRPAISCRRIPQDPELL